MLKNITKSNQSTSSEEEEPLIKEGEAIFIPDEIYKITELNCRQKLLWVAIHYLDGPDGCRAPNAYLAKEMQINKASLGKALAKLKEKGLIYQESFDGRVRVLRTRYPGH
jgi:DNA-binding MarR family transcriptional regulator